MLFKRRDQLTLPKRIRVWLWPNRSWKRSGTYQLKRLVRLSGSPYAIAMGCAAGAFASFTPLIGFHFVIAIVIAWLLRGNLIAAAIGTVVGNPLTFPLIWASTFRVGQTMIPGVDQNAPMTLGSRLQHQSALEIWPLLKPMLLGSIPLGLAVGGIVYLLVYRMAATFKLARQVRLAERGSRARGHPDEPSTYPSEAGGPPIGTVAAKPTDSRW